MGDCSLCSILSFLFSCVYSLISCALDYPLVVFLLSFLIAVIFITNVHTAKMICNFSSNGEGSLTSCGGGSMGGGSTCSTNSLQGSIMNAFDYGAERGPHTWRCSSTNQSPINIIEEDVQKFPIREWLTWNHYDDLPSAIMLENNGHTIILRASYSGNVPTVSGADLLASYTFVELCFRWSILNTEGSEHMLNCRKFPMEMQAMHRTGPSGDCTSSYDLLMIAYLFEISANNPFLDPIIHNLHRIQRPGTKVEIPPFPLSYLCHQFRTNFYSYGGSLTEPPCYQGAEWFIFPVAIAISENQLNEFRQLLSANGKTRIQRNARPVQSLGCSRVVNLNQYNPIEAACISATTISQPPPCDDEQCEDEDECFA